MRVTMKNKKTLVWGAGLLLVLALGLFSFFYLNRSAHKEKRTYRTFEAITSRDIIVFGENKQFVAITRGWSAGKRYTISQEGHILDKVDGEYIPYHAQRKEEHWNVVIFDLNQEGYPSQKVDLYQAVRSYNPSYFPIMSNHLIHYQEVDYLTVTIRPEGEKDSDKDKKVFLNLETHEISDIPEDYSNNNAFDDRPSSLDHDLYADTNRTTLAKVADENGFLLSNTLHSTSSKNEAKINLSKEYPEVMKILDAKGTIYPRFTMVSSEDWFNHMLHWLAPEGEEVLTVYLVENRYNKNSQPLTDYPIQSYQDYLNWKEQQEKKE